MSEPRPINIGRLERELAYYRRECNDLGARLLRLQEEQHGLLAGLESADVDLTRTMLQLLIVGLRAERAHIASLVSAREALLERAGVGAEGSDAHE